MDRPVRPRVALTLGDPNGIGPEIGVKLAARPQNRDKAQIVLFADPAIVPKGVPRSVVWVARSEGLAVPRVGAAG